ncbi:LPS-assembly protein LptD precursor, partial [Haemophilus influenzae]
SRTLLSRSRLTKTSRTISRRSI